MDSEWDEVREPRISRGVLVLFGVFVALLWAPWPGYSTPYWQSDDFLALVYSSSLDRALSDFAGPQYGAEDLWLFYRPLITLSFWFDQTLGSALSSLSGLRPAEATAWISHGSNALTHAISSVLIACIWSRFLRPHLALGIALLWAVMPSHAGSVLWAVGRVDCHTAVWCIAAVWALLRGLERGKFSWAALVFCAAALCSKEIAFTLPGILWVVAYAWQTQQRRDQELLHSYEEHPPEPLPLVQRLIAPTLSILPFAVLLGVFLIYRTLVLDVFLGGYDTGAATLSGMATGFGSTWLNVFSPAMTTGWLPELANEATSARTPMGTLPWNATSMLSATAWVAAGLWALAVVVTLLRRRPGRLFASLTLACIACLPLLPLMQGLADNPMNPRYMYLPAACLVGVLAALSWPGIIVWIVLAAAPWWTMRSEYEAAWAETARSHAALLTLDEEARAELPAEESPINNGDIFVRGLREVRPGGLAMVFHFGTDRLLHQCFGGWGATVRPLRAFAEIPGVFRSAPAGEEPAPPNETAFITADEGRIAGRLPGGVPGEVPPTAIDARLQGIDLWSKQRLVQLAESEITPAFAILGAKPAILRLTFFTGFGAMTVYTEPAKDAGNDARVPLKEFFTTARWGAAGDTYLLTGLSAAAIHDETTRWPVLIEGGAFDGAPDPSGGNFRVSHRARELIDLQFDRTYPAGVRAVLGLQR